MRRFNISIAVDAIDYDDALALANYALNEVYDSGGLNAIVVDVAETFLMVGVDDIPLDYHQ